MTNLEITQYINTIINKLPEQFECELNSVRKKGTQENKDIILKLEKNILEALETETIPDTLGESVLKLRLKNRIKECNAMFERINRIAKYKY